jgi:hypothetical protein
MKPRVMLAAAGLVGVVLLGPAVDETAAPLLVMAPDRDRPAAELLPTPSPPTGRLPATTPRRGAALPTEAPPPGPTTRGAPCPPANQP